MTTLVLSNCYSSFKLGDINLIHLKRNITCGQLCPITAPGCQYIFNHNTSWLHTFSCNQQKSIEPYINSTIHTPFNFDFASFAGSVCSCSSSISSSTSNSFCYNHKKSTATWKLELTCSLPGYTNFMLLLYTMNFETASHIHFIISTSASGLS